MVCTRTNTDHYSYTIGIWCLQILDRYCKRSWYAYSEMASCCDKCCYNQKWNLNLLENINFIEKIITEYCTIFRKNTEAVYNMIETS